MSNEITRRIRQKYGTVAHFARVHGYNVRTVHDVLYGQGGKLESPKTITGQIVARLKREGLWVEPREAK